MVKLGLASILALFVLTTAHAQQPADDPETFFELRVRPILATRCFKCHGGDKTSSGLRVDSREALLRGGEHGPAVVPRDPQASLLIRAVRRGEDRKMPPDEALDPAAGAALEKWVAQGAAWPAKSAAAEQASFADRHWAFKPVAHVEVPDDPSGWSETPIDRFIMAKLSSQGLRPRPPADRSTLLRRLSFDLIGLPPAPDEVAAFSGDESPDAFDALVERLVASPHYGQRWGRHWMDVVRYADTAGDNADYPVPEVRRYRDYIIQAFNDDQPYNQFIREQLAGDILASRQPSPTDQYARRIAATGFLALSRRYATAPYELWHLTLEDAIDTTGRAILGLSLRCARCHDHKFDPITNEDYYALYGIFSSTQFPWAGGEELQSKKFDRQHFVPLVPPDQAAPKLATYRDQIAAIEAELKHAETEDPDAKRVAELDAQIKTLSETADASSTDSSGAELATAKRQRAETNRRLQVALEQRRAQLRLLHRTGLPPDLPAAYAVSEGQAADARVQRRGEPTDPGDVVPRGIPKFLSLGSPLTIPPTASGRWELAQWITRPDHPLTARVIVNRVWQHHFGKGLVTTPSDFGLRGEPPTHPELLDWLTTRFVDGGWSIKSLHRIIMRSKVYQLASDTDPLAASRDQGNRWYWRFDRRRLEAEAIRDAMLVAADRLDRRGPSDHPFPPIADWNWTQHSPFKAVYPSNHRSVYLMTQRLQRHPYLALFDGPDPNLSTDVRTSATVPLQALYLMNNPFVAEQSAAFARRLIDAQGDPAQRIALAFSLAYARQPTSSERDRGLNYIDAYAAECRSAGVAAPEAESEAWTSYARVLLTASEFVYID